MNESNFDHRRRGLCVAAVLALLFTFAAFVHAQPYVPGVTYFGRSNYIEYIAGELPIIISAPHGGTLQPSEMPNRTNCVTCPGWDFTTATDTATDDLARKARTEIQNLTGLTPHIIICRVDRDKIDCNRDVVEGAQGDPEAVQAWNEFQNFIIASRTNVVALHGRGFYIDLHGHGHTIQRLELGYLLSSSQLGLSDATLNSTTYENQSSIRRLSLESPLTFPELLRGSLSFGNLMETEGFPSVPSLSTPNPGGNPYFNGGYNTRQHTSVNLGLMDGLQIESNYTGVRDSSSSRTAFGKAIARVLENYFVQHYHITLRTCVPKIWDVGSGNWSSAASWYDSALPVSTNRILFVGTGGTSVQNLSALTTGSGFVHSLSFSNSVTGSYTVSGNAMSLLAGVTNNSAFAHTVNNNLTLAGNQSFVASLGDLTFAGGIINPETLTVSGNANVTLNGIVSDAGALFKSGAGMLSLNAVNSYTGPTTNASGTIRLNATSTFGSGDGLLVLGGGDILSANTRSGAPIDNPILLAGTSAIYGNGSFTNSLRILPFSSGDITTASGSLMIRNASPNPYASNNVFRVRLSGGGFAFTRPLTIGFIGDLPGAQSELECHNSLAAGDQTFSGSISGTGILRHSAPDANTAGRTILTGANSYSGGTIVAAGTLLANNVIGSATGSGFVAVSNNAVLGGKGAISGPVNCAGTIAPGESCGILTFAGGLDLSEGGTSAWELSALSTENSGTNFDEIILAGGNLALGGASKLELNFIGNASAPNPGDPFWLTSHTWKIISLTNGATNPGLTSFSTILNAVYPTGSFVTSADASGNILLSYIAAPAASPIIESVQTISPDEIVLTFATETNRSYVVQCAADLSTTIWTNISTNVAPADLLTLTNAIGDDPARFYRVLVLP